MDVEITEMPELRVGVVRADMAHMREAWERLGALAGSAGLMGQPGVAMASILPVEAIERQVKPGHASNATPLHRIRYDAAVVVPEGVPLPDGLLEDRVPAGRYARAVHLGPYAALPEAWARFTGDWLPASGRQLGNGVCYEIYRNDPSTVPEADLRTDLYIPIA